VDFFEVACSTTSMRIVLMRHGKPVMPTPPWLPPAELSDWIAQYDRSEVARDGIPRASVTAAAAAAVIVASNLPRAISSARALGQNTFTIDPVFREARLPFALWRYPRLPPAAWAVFFRLLWLCGYARGADSVRATRRRARLAAERLVALAQDGPVLLVGHGIMNRLIGGELLALGWAARDQHGSKYWSTNAYVRNR
jgi:broad specificity phosphatase PhoE